jgi:hypothetical protein
VFVPPGHCRTASMLTARSRLRAALSLSIFRIPAAPLQFSRCVRAVMRTSLAAIRLNQTSHSPILGNLGAIGVADCDLSVYGPNGFFRAFKGSVSALRTAQLDLQIDYDEILGDITLVITNLSTQSAKVSILDKYRNRSVDLRERQHKRPCDGSDLSYAHRSGVIRTDSVTPF